MRCDWGRFYCKIVTRTKIIKSKPNSQKVKVDITELTHRIKVPQTPVPANFSKGVEDFIEINAKTIQLLERLSLVDLDSKQALKTLKSSIHFADRITQIDIFNVRPLYTVLEKQELHLRNDIVTDEDRREELLHIAQVTHDDYYVSPPGNIPLEQLDKQ